LQKKTVRYLFNELMSRGGTSARQRQIDAGYGESDDVYQARLRRAQNMRSFNNDRANPEQMKNALEVIDLAGKAADAIAIGGAAVGNPVVFAFAGTAGVAIDTIKFAMTGDFWGYLIDIGVPLGVKSAVPASTRPGWNGIRELFGISIKETVQDARQKN
jgi:hypothetical protein